MLATVKSLTTKRLRYFLHKKRLNKPNLSTEFQFPSAFNPCVYKENYKALRAYTDEQLYQHYKLKGIKQGKRAHLLKDRIDFVKLIPSHKKILEIGPFFNPLTMGNNVFYFDVLNREKLINKAKALGFSYEANHCPEIQFVSRTGDLSIIKEKFDVVLSSHSIEHQPNLVKHLNDVSNILNPNGYYFLMAPDKRYCFDHFMSETNVAHVIDIHHKRQRFHSLCSLLENRLLTTHNDSVKHWKGEHGEIDFTAYAEKFKNVIAEHKNSAGHYIDAHAWYFIPDSFRKIMTILYELSYIQLKIEEIYPTLYGKNEFWAILKNSPNKD